jgi:hypothetical protein
MRHWRGASRLACLALILCALAGFASIPLDSPIQFSRGTPVPRPVQAFAWRVITQRCAYQSYELSQRSFWAADAGARAAATETVYTIRVLSEVGWMKTDPVDVIEMTIVDDGRLRLAALRSSFIICSP